MESFQIFKILIIALAFSQKILARKSCISHSEDCCGNTSFKDCDKRDNSRAIKSNQSEGFTSSNMNLVGGNKRFHQCRRPSCNPVTNCQISSCGKNICHCNNMCFGHNMCHGCNCVCPCCGRICSSTNTCNENCCTHFGYPHRHCFNNNCGHHSGNCMNMCCCYNPMCRSQGCSSNSCNHQNCCNRICNQKRCNNHHTRNICQTSQRHENHQSSPMSSSNCAMSTHNKYSSSENNFGTVGSSKKQQKFEESIPTRITESSNDSKLIRDDNDE